jgi:hypothetical protein
MGHGHYRKNLDKEESVREKTSKKEFIGGGTIHPEISRRAQIVEMKCFCGTKFNTTVGEKESGTRYCPDCRDKKNKRDRFAIRQIRSGGVFDS